MRVCALTSTCASTPSPPPPQVPPQLDARVRPHVNLRFDAFYDLIYHNFALIPTLASEAYYDRKFSSTVITRQEEGREGEGGREGPVLKEEGCKFSSTVITR